MNALETLLGKKILLDNIKGSPLPLKIQNPLIADQYSIFAQLLFVSEKQLLKTPRLGEKAISEINKLLAPHKLRIGQLSQNTSPEVLNAKDEIFGVNDLGPQITQEDAEAAARKHFGFTVSLVFESSALYGGVRTTIPLSIPPQYAQALENGQIVPGDLAEKLNQAVSNTVKDVILEHAEQFTNEPD